MTDLIDTIAVEERYTIGGKAVIIRRDDLAYKPPLPPNAKMSALCGLIERAAANGYKKVVMFAKKQQGISYAVGLPVFCEMFGLEPIITYPTRTGQPVPEWLVGLGVEAHGLWANLVYVNVAQSKKLADGVGAYFVPFGFDDALSVDIHAQKFALPDYEIGTLVMATMTGMILAGTLRQIRDRGYSVKRIVAISGGRPSENVLESVNKYIGGFDGIGIPFERLSILNPYDRNVDARVAVDRLHNLYNATIPTAFHPDYELKAWCWLLENLANLEPPIYFINVGR